MYSTFLQEDTMKNYEHYAYQVVCINTLKTHGLISEEEYERFKNHIRKKYKIVSSVNVGI